MLLNDVNKVTDGVYPFHMPGHKRQQEWLEGLTLADITEITGADDLHAPNGIIAAAQARATRLFGTISTIFLSGGSTCGILSAIFALTKKGDTVLIGRNCHKAVYNACLLNSLKTEFLIPSEKMRLGIWGEITAQEVDTAMKQSGAKTVVITSPTYEGIVSDIKSIAKTVHKNGGILIVDSAHGAHLGLNDYFPKSARELGADIVIESAHKTLPCLTGAALLHICSHRISYSAIQASLGIFETSSPSYPIICSIDRTLCKICEADLFTPYTQKLEDFYNGAKELKNLSIFTSADFDKGKIVISCEKANISGFELKKILLEKYKIELEMAMPRYALAMTSIADTDDGFKRLLAALIEIDKTLQKEEKPPFIFPKKCKKVYEIFEEKETELVKVKDSLNKISAEFVYAYPPGSPILAKGERFSGEVLAYLDFLYASGAQVLSDGGNFPEYSLVFKEND